MSSDESDGDALDELVVCSLEAWDGVWRRNQFFVDLLLTRNPGLRVLLVEPPADPLFDLTSRRVPTLPRARKIRADGRLRTLRPLKALPRKAGPAADASLLWQVVAAARLLRFRKPVLWINDVTYAPLISRARWPAVYDVTDDWLLAPFSERELDRLHRLDELALRDAEEVVVCSPALAASRGSQRSVTLIPNGVDVDHLRRPQARPKNLPPSPVAVYVGSLHEARLDVDLVADLAGSKPSLNIAFVGPNGLSDASTRRLAAFSNVSLLGPQPYSKVPAYLQHASVIVVPHVLSPFTESLDPIKAYECLAVETPTVATRVAGFREHENELHLVAREDFVRKTDEVLSLPTQVPDRPAPPSWDERAVAFESCLVGAIRSQSALLTKR